MSSLEREEICQEHEWVVRPVYMAYFEEMQAHDQKSVSISDLEKIPRSGL